MSNTFYLSQDKRNESLYDKGGLSFLQTMSDITTIVSNKEEKAYIHPIEKRSVSKLNEKSLEMCTESLGTETGSESGDDLSLLLALQATPTPRVPSPQPKRNLDNKKSKMSRENTFPPPIKFVGDSKYNRMVRWLDEDGRLVVQSIRVLPPSRCFVADRSEGRLRLCLSSAIKHKHVKEEEEEEEEEETEECKSGNKKLNRLSRRCNENGRESKPMLTWKQQQFWVAT